MKLSTRTRYGIRAVLELAEHFGQEPLQLKNIASQQDISVKYLEQLMTMLKSSGIVSSIRGSKGGYMLSRSPSNITLNECYRSLEGALITVECVQNGQHCPRTDSCAAREVWAEIDNAVVNILKSTTLQDIVDKAKYNRALHYQI